MSKDTYPFLARVQPVLIALAPLFILGILFSFEFEKYIHILTSIGIYSVMSFVIAELGRDSGLKKQSALWASWGGAYTIQLLRWENQLLPRQTKLDYYSRLEKKYSLSDPFDCKSDNDDIFAFWSGNLREQTRDKKKYPLVYAENVSYGFRRNLLGMKSLGITLIIICSSSMVVYYYTELQNFNLICYPLIFWYNLISDGLLLLFWTLIVNSEWVKLAAIAYATRLLSNA